MVKMGMKKNDPNSPHYQKFKKIFGLNDEELQEWIDHKQDYLKNRIKVCKVCHGEFKTTTLMNFLIQWGKYPEKCNQCLVLGHRREFQ